MNFSQKKYRSDKNQADSSVWISWGHQIRNRSMAKQLGAKLYVFNYNRDNQVSRYLKCTYKTLKCIINERPMNVFAPNPSAVSICLLICLRVIFQYKLIIDAHYAGVVTVNDNRYFQMLLDYLNRRADMVIVTNNEHANHIGLVGGKTFICQDPIPDLSQYHEDENEDSKIVFVICSFDIDEPYLEIFKAAKILKKHGFNFIVSGDFNKVKLDTQKYDYMTFLGYCEDYIFYSYLFRSNIIVDLTTLENCLVCGAYESMAAERILVTSETKALSNFFTHGTVLVKNTSDDICRGIHHAYNNRMMLKGEISKWKKKTIKEQQIKKNNLLKSLQF